jgi:hypothetical protein
MNKSKIFIMSIVLSAIFCVNAFAGEWKQIGNEWKYQEDNGSYPENTWKEINDHWYYFNEEGYMLRDTTTPDGYIVGESGEWVQSESQKVEASSTGKTYTFDKKGKWVDDGDIPEGDYVYYPDEHADDVMGSSSWVSNFNYIRLYKGDIINTGVYVPVSDVGELDITKEGVFLVGKDIKAGTYNLVPFEYNGQLLKIKCMVFDTIPSSKDQTTPQKNLAQSFLVHKNTNNTVTVKDGQYIQIIGCSADFVRP